MFTDYDVIIIGAGAAGMAAGIYTSRAGFSTLILEKNNLGGELVSRQLIENYPGFSDGIMGPELAGQMIGQAENAGAEFDTAEVLSIEDKGSYKVVNTDAERLSCNGIIVATGSHPRLMDIPGEKELTGKGVFYCATCDGPLCAGKPVMVVGGGDSALTEALHLSKLGCSVTVLIRKSAPRASQVLQDRVAKDPNITLKLNHRPLRVIGNDWTEGVEVEDVTNGAREVIAVNGVYVRVGQISNTEFLSSVLELSASAQVMVDENMQTAIAGICAAGDIRVKSPAQISTAVGDGVTAAMALGRYLNTL